MHLRDMERTVGSSGLSIGTHLMLESLFPELEPYDKEREIPNKVKLSDYKYHFFNVFTLMRNIVNSFKELDKQLIYKHKDFKNILLDELYTLTGYYSDTKLVIYKCNYDKVRKALNNGKPESHAKKYTDFLTNDKIIEAIFKETDELQDLVVTSKDFRISSPKEKVLLTTSHIADVFNFRDVELLESHTGKLRPKTLMYTKYHDLGKQDMSMLPFLEELLYMLGDNTMVVPLHLSDRRQLLDLAVSKNWNVLTTRDKVVTDIKSVPELKTAFGYFNRIYPS